MYCSKCGNALPEGSLFCSRCGQPVSPTAAPPTPVRTPAPSAVSPHWRPAPAVAYAGFWLRFVAYLVDRLIIGVVSAAIFIPLFIFGGGLAFLRNVHPGENPDPQFILFLFTFYGVAIVLGLVGGWLYYAYFESSTWQGTVGKKILNLVVTDMTGNRVTFGRASARFFAKIVTGLTMGIGYILAGFTEKKQALHDMIASCLVLRRY